jgi:hypothetical protein
VKGREMGTNYYWVGVVEDTCLHCGHKEYKDEEKKHIGKSSTGWVFGLHIYPDDEINTLDDWVKVWYTQLGHIEDEYGDTIDRISMLSKIMCRTNTGTFVPSNEWYKQNQAAPGPNRLSYRNGQGVIGHGENNGTWDYLVGDFS